jgi:hypothetical protein
VRCAENNDSLSPSIVGADVRMDGIPPGDSEGIVKGGPKGTQTRALRRSPFSVVFFGEIGERRRNCVRA